MSIRIPNAPAADDAAALAALQREQRGTGPVVPDKSLRELLKIDDEKQEPVSAGATVQQSLSRISRPAPAALVA